MKPLVHAKNSVRKYKGNIEDYLEIHSFMDSSKAHIADNRHRLIFHSSLGIYIVERVFGTYFTNSDGIDVSVRAIAEDHCYEDVGVIPSLQDYLEKLPIEPWMATRATKESYPPSCKEIMENRKTKIVRMTD